MIAHSSYFAFNDGFDNQTFDFGSYNTTAATSETWNFAMPTGNMVNGAILWGPDIANNNGNSWMTSSSSAVGIELTFSAGVTAVMHDPNNQTDQADGTALSSGIIFNKVAGTPTSRTWYVEFTFANYTNDFQLVADYQGGPSWFGSGVDFTSLTACSDIDRDNDNIPDKFDADSDGDTCPDARESGASTSKTDETVATTYAQVNHNGFADHLETSNFADATYNFNSAYPIAQTTLINGCQDYDDDGVGDIIDLDDDNDGILDKLEMLCTGVDAPITANTYSTANGNGSGMHIAGYKYVLGTDSLSVDIQVDAHPSYWYNNDGIENGAFDFVAYNTVGGTKEHYAFGMPKDNVVNGSIIWGPHAAENANTYHNQVTTAVDITVTWTGGE